MLDMKSEGKEDVIYWTPGYPGSCKYRDRIIAFDILCYQNSYVGKPLSSEGGYTYIDLLQQFSKWGPFFNGAVEGGPAEKIS